MSWGQRHRRNERQTALAAQRALDEASRGEWHSLLPATVSQLPPFYCRSQSTATGPHLSGQLAQLSDVALLAARACAPRSSAARRAAARIGERRAKIWRSAGRTGKTCGSPPRSRRSPPQSLGQGLPREAGPRSGLFGAHSPGADPSLSGGWVREGTSSLERRRCATAFSSCTGGGMSARGGQAGWRGRCRRGTAGSFSFFVCVARGALVAKRVSCA
jgi:hypothetical protein